jgi:hypothetical protein
MELYVFYKIYFLGSEGSYNILGVPVEFQKDEMDNTCQDSGIEGAGVVSYLANKCLNSNAFRWITQGYTHLLAHEASHALAYKLISNENQIGIKIFQNSCQASISYILTEEMEKSWKGTVVEAAGPMGDVAFSTCKLVAATALRNYITWPVSLALGGGALFWISGELLYAYSSASNRDGGDFGQIANRSKTHLAVASAALMGECALGIFAAYKLAA